VLGVPTYSCALILAYAAQNGQPFSRATNFLEAADFGFLLV